MKLTSEPSLINLVEAIRENIFSTLNCHAIGKIESFDSINQTANISILYQRKVENFEETNSREDYPLLIDVPLIILGGGKGSIRFPIETGDNCILFFNDRDIDNWYSSGAKTPLSSNRKHSFSDALALIGPKSLANTFSDYDKNRTELVHDKTQVSLSDKIRIKNQTQNLYDIIDGLFTQLGALVPNTGIPAANKTAIAALQVQFQQLMEH